MKNDRELLQENINDEWDIEELGSAFNIKVEQSPIYLYYDSSGEYISNSEVESLRDIIDLDEYTDDELEELIADSEYLQNEIDNLKEIYREKQDE